MKNISTRNSIFRLYNEFLKTKDHYCDVGVQIDENLYEDGNVFYYITYTYTYSHELEESYLANPLFYKDDKDDIIIVKNELSDILCNYLLMDLDELAKYSGYVTPTCYKSSIMRIPLDLWT